MAKVGDIINDVLLESEIGSGSSGMVFLGKNLKDESVTAVKVIRIAQSSGSKSNSALQNELNVGLNVGKECPFLVAYQEIVMKTDACYIFLEYFSKGDLQKLIGNHVKEQTPFTQEEVCIFLFEITTALKALHDAGILHRDLKPGNIFISRDSVFKLGDYSLAHHLDALFERSMTAVGTLGYVSPELLEGKKNYSFGVDVFALGCILWQMMFLCHPFSNPDGHVNQRLLLLGTPVLPTDGPKTLCSPRLVALARLMLDLDPAKRPSLQTILSVSEINAAGLLLAVRFLKALEESRPFFPPNTTSSAPASSRPVPHPLPHPAVPPKAKARAPPVASPSTASASFSSSSTPSAPQAKAKARAIASSPAASSSSPVPSPAPAPSTGTVGVLAGAVDYPLTVRTNPEAGNRVVIQGNSYRFKNYATYFFMLDKEISSGIWRSTFEHVGESDGLSPSYGVIPEQTEYSYNSYLHFPPYNLGAAINSSDIQGHDQENWDSSEKATPVRVAVELDADANTVHFFVDGKLRPHFISGLPESPLFMAFSGYDKLTIRILSFQKLSVSSIPSTAQCTPVPYIDDDD